MKIGFLLILGFLVFFAGIGVMVFSMSLVYAESTTTLRHPSSEIIDLTIMFDQENYKTGDTISMVGHLGNKDLESPATVTLVRPDGKIVTSIEMMPVDNKVSYQFTAGIGNMNVSGIYHFELFYDDQTILKQFSFNATENISVTQVKTVEGDAPFFGIFVYVDNFFSWITGK